MTDSLRDRIAASISEGLFVKGVYCEYGTGDEPGDWQRVDGHINLTTLADAVIAALDERGWLIDPEFDDRRRRARNKRWLEGENDE